jgi:hypothetical protein
MQTLQTIEEIHKVFQTAGSSPLLVTCNDFRDWVCKYDKSPRNLLNELIAKKFADEWNILTPEIAFIKVNKEHVPFEKYKIVPQLFDKECFGSLHLDSSKEIDLSLISLFKDATFKDKIANKTDFLKIALFDIWLANEDRNHNNFNLLLFANANKLNFFYAIDHVNIFNSSYLNYGITEITEDDSIIKTEIAKILFNNKKELALFVDNLIENFYLYTKECQNKLDEILDLTPSSWKINKNEVRSKILENIFTKEWNTNCVNTFKGFVQSFIIK